MPSILIAIFCFLLVACGPPSNSPEHKINQFLSKIEDEPKDPTLHYELGRAYIEKKGNYILNLNSHLAIMCLREN